MRALDLHRCSINTATLGHREPIATVIDRVARAGYGAIAPWRREIDGAQGFNVEAVARRIREAGLGVSGYCRSTDFPAADRASFLAGIDDNRRALDQAAALGAACFVLVVGGLPEGSRDLAGAREQVREGVARLLDDARARGVRLALEPLHPMYAADRSCLTTIAEALDLCRTIEPEPGGAPALGLAVDVYHVWWDPAFTEGIAAAGRERRLFAFHVCDWLRVTRDLLLDRGMMGDGVIALRGIRAMVEAAGYGGATEVEIFSAQNWWTRPPDETLAACAERLVACC